MTGKPVEAGDVNVKGESGGDDREKSKPNLKATLDIKANMRKKAGVRSPWLRVLKGNTDAVRCLVALPDGRLALGSQDGTVRVWRVDGKKREIGRASCRERV